MRLHLVRHPRPEVADDTCYGRTDLAPRLDELVLLQAILAASLPQHAPLFSSPLQRCARLAETLAPALGCGAPVFDARLAEMDFGDWEMREWNQIPRSEVDAWAADLTGYRPGAGENVLEVAQRVCAFRADLAALHAEDVIVICHAGTIRLLLAAECGTSPAEMALQAAQTAHRIAYGEVIVLDCRPTA